MKLGYFLSWKALVAIGALPFLAAALSPPASLQAADESSPAAADFAAPIADAATDSPLTNVSPMAVAPAAAAVLPDIKLYGGTAQIVKLAQAGVGKDVMLSYITNANVRFALTSDQIIYLNDLGISGDVLTAMLQHDAAAPVAPMPGNAAAAMVNEPAAPVNATDQTAQDDYAPASPAMDYSVAANPPAEVNPYPEVYPGPVAGDAAYFYDSLAPYGNWVNLPSYGPCWQPTVYVGDHNWRPYGDRGRWVYTDNGWYWQSDYSWGWAAFHYGRWHQDRTIGWLWVPDKVWGPAWVSWRATRDYAGWAPLPPSAVYAPGAGLRFHNRNVSATFDFGLSSSAFTFIPTERLSDYYPITYGITRVATSGIFNQSVVVNNATEANRQVFCGGIDPWRIVAAGGTPARRALLRESRDNPDDHRFRSDRVDVRGNSLVIIRPTLPEPGGKGTEGTASTSRVHVNYVKHEDSKLAVASAVPVPADASYSTARFGTYRPGSAPPAGRQNMAEPVSATTSVPARTSSTILLPKGAASTSYSSRNTMAAGDNVTTVRVTSQRTLSPSGNGSSTTDEQSRSFPRASYLTTGGRQDSSAVAPGSSSRSPASGSVQTSGVLLPRSQGAYGLESSTPAGARSQSIGIQQSSAPAYRAPVLLPTQSYSQPAPRSYQAPASYSAPAPAASSGHSSSSSSSSSSTGSGRGR